MLPGALLILAVVPFPLFVIMPVNRAMQATRPADAGPDTRALLGQWAALHWVRNLLGIAAVAALTVAAAN